MNQATELTLKHINLNTQKYATCCNIEQLKIEVEKNKNEFLGMVETGRGKTWSWRKAREDWDSIDWEVINKEMI